MKKSKKVSQLSLLKKENESLREQLDCIFTRVSQKEREFYEEKRAQDRAKWREEANKELQEILEAKKQEIKALKRPWYKRFF